MKTLPALMFSSALVITGCGSSSSGSDTGKLTLGLTDGPVENAEQVVVTFNAVELHGAENKTITFDEPKAINLLAYQGEDRIVLLDDEVLQAGNYQWIRLAVDEASSYILIDGQQHTLDIPSGAQTGLKLNRGFTLAADGSTDFAIDFDLRKSVTLSNQGYKLRPTLRITDNLQSGTISGTVAASLIEDASCNNGDNNDQGNAVYLFSGSDAELQDIQTNAGDPLASATVVYDGEQQQYRYTLGFVPYGDYSVTFTCNSSLDNADEDNSALMNFSPAVNVSLNDQQASANISAPEA